MSRRKLTATEKAERRRRKKEFMTIFVNGKQKRIRRPPAVEGIDPYEFILRNADPIWLHQNEMWELLDESGTIEPLASADRAKLGQSSNDAIAYRDEATYNEGGAIYFNVVIVARSPKTDIWLAHEGHLVQKSDGVLETSILPGGYTVEFGLGSATYPLHVAGDVRLTEEEITAGPPCPRPAPYVSPLDSDP